MSSQRSESQLVTARSQSPLKSDDKRSVRSSKSRRFIASSFEHQKRVRFVTTTAVLFTMGLMVFIAENLLVVESILAKFVDGGDLDCSFQWCWVYSNGLTHRTHAYFDEVNILETYQPRARTHGHLFLPDPPTPVPEAAKTSSAENLLVPKQTKSEFELMRDAVSPKRLIKVSMLECKHYANEFEHMKRVGKEMDDAKAAGRPFTKPGASFEEAVSIEFSEPEEDDDQEDL
ncbi:hypothetical protein M3Y98_01022100 [Aphelenchoides besseyi]|nr:hypothetical protein M3Y98_01022100 [Aphelenchoides besseyi]